MKRVGATMGGVGTNMSRGLTVVLAVLALPPAVLADFPIIRGYITCVRRAP
jgi:hypothetical protein